MRAGAAAIRRASTAARIHGSPSAHRGCHKGCEQQGCPSVHRGEAPAPLHPSTARSRTVERAAARHGRDRPARACRLRSRSRKAISSDAARPTATPTWTSTSSSTMTPCRLSGTARWPGCQRIARWCWITPCLGPPCATPPPPKVVGFTCGPTAARRSASRMAACACWSQAPVHRFAPHRPRHPSVLALRVPAVIGRGERSVAVQGLVMDEALVTELLMAGSERTWNRGVNHLNAGMWKLRWCAPSGHPGHWWTRTCGAWR